MLRMNNPRLKPQLVVVGEPNQDYPEIATQMDRSQYAAEIIRPGFVSEPDLVQLYQTAEALIFPSLYEGFGLPPIEAMASGTPVIASDASCLPEILGSAAGLVPAGNSEALAQTMEKVLTDRLFWRRLRAAGLAHARGFSWKKMAEQTLAVYESTLEAS
jgi:glycosyltransferase involved in cell wall biosynthesis